MKRRLVALMVVGLVLALAGMAYLLLVRARQSTPVVETLSLPSGEAGPVALVKIAAVKKGAIQETIRVYGTVIPAPGATNALSVPYESRVHRIMVNEGQEVSPGDPLLEIGPSPETRLKFDQAAESYNTARQALQNMERKFKLKLATNDQVLQAKQASDQAGLNLESMKRQGVDGVHEMKAQAKGLVSRVAVDQGAIVAAGAPLMLVVPENRFELRLGVEPTDIGRVHPGMPVVLSLVLVPAAPVVTGQVRKISRSVNPSTRLVDVFVSVPAPSVFLLGQYISGTITTASVEGLIVPRSAVLSEEKGSVVYIVRDGRAHAKSVRTLAEQGSETCVAGPDLQPGDRVVVMGNYELTDNMRVDVETGQ